jgi:hypothetical protein
MYPKGINSGAFLKGAGGKLLGAAKGLGEKVEHGAVMAALVAAAPEVATKYGLLEKGKK